MRLSILVAITTVFASPLSGQRGDGSVRVEVASIKAVERDNPRRAPCLLPSFERTGTRIYTPFSQVCGLVRFAYDLADYQVVGIPNNSTVGPSHFFEVNVRVTGVDVASREEARLVVRELLTDRFKLRTHFESREMPIYVLGTTAGGPRMTSCSDPKAASGYMPGRIISCEPPLPIPRLLQFLSTETGRPVFDKTGLAARTFELRWLPNQAKPEADSPPDLFTAIQEQLGLKLEPSRGPVDTLIVDAVEPPSLN